MADGAIRVLLIDDEGAAGRTAVILASGDRWDLRRVDRVPAAFAALAGQRFDLVLLCGQPEGRDPLAVLGELREAVPAMPLLLVAAAGDAGDVTQLAFDAVRAGAQDVVTAAALAGEAGRRIMLTAIERKRAEEHRLRFARTDEVTGLANLALLEERFARAMARAERQSTLIGLVAIEIDDFAERLADLAPPFGDALLRAVGQRLIGHVRRTDTLARSRSRGFAWLVEGLTSVDAIGDLVDRLPVVLQAPFRIDQVEINLTASVGVVICPFHGRGFKDLLAMAEAAMFDVATVNGDGLLMPPLPAVREPPLPVA
jgi:diguanylate cyclase (GGDEF)-like protein